MQFLLQVFLGRAVPPGAHPQAQGVQAPQNAHMSVLREILHPGDLPHQAHAETRREDGQEAAHYRYTSGGSGQPSLLAQDVPGHGQLAGGRDATDLSISAAAATADAATVFARIRLRSQQRHRAQRAGAHERRGHEVFRPALGGVPATGLPRLHHIFVGYEDLYVGFHADPEYDRAVPPPRPPPQPPAPSRAPPPLPLVRLSLQTVPPDQLPTSVLGADGSAQDFRVQRFPQPTHLPPSDTELRPPTRPYPNDDGTPPTGTQGEGTVSFPPRIPGEFRRDPRAIR